MDVPQPPKPQRPDFERSAQEYVPQATNSRGGSIWLVLIGFALLASLAVAALAFPVLWLGVGLVAAVGLQYLVWGWLFERIYR